MYNYDPEYDSERKQNLKLAGIKLAMEVKHGYPFPKFCKVYHQSTLTHMQV